VGFAEQRIQRRIADGVIGFGKIGLFCAHHTASTAVTSGT
jgi:hypothetical protein